MNLPENTNLQRWDNTSKVEVNFDEDRWFRLL